MATIAQALQFAKESSIAEVDSRTLLKFYTNFSDLDILVNSNSNLTESEFSAFKTAIEERQTGKPVAYITGEKEFFGLNFKVNEHTLIPRPETELLVEKVLDYIAENKLEKPRILDLGTGSGAIIISLLANSDATGVAVDLNPKALEKAHENAKLNGVSEKLGFVQSSWFSNLKNEKFDIIVANPPYITTKMMSKLEKDVADFEPNLALEGGELGYEPYIEIVQNSPTFLKSKGKLFLEIGFDQKNSVLDLFDSETWKDKKCFKDYANNDRIITSSLKN